MFNSSIRNVLTRMEQLERRTRRSICPSSPKAGYNNAEWVIVAAAVHEMDTVITKWYLFVDDEEGHFRGV